MIGGFALVGLFSVRFVMMEAFQLTVILYSFPQTKTPGVCSAPDLPDLGEVPRHCVSLQQFAPQQTSDWGTCPTSYKQIASSDHLSCLLNGHVV